MKSTKGKRLSLWMLGLMLSVLILAGCGGESAEPTSTPTRIPPTDIPTPSATDTPTPVPAPSAIPGSETPFTVGGVQLQITSVSLGTAMFAPAGMAEDETVLTVEIKVLSGNPDIVAKTDGEFDVWTTDNSERRNSTRAATSTRTGDGKIHAIEWLFGVAKSSESLYLHFPGGVTVDLSPLLP